MTKRKTRMDNQGLLSGKTCSTLFTIILMLFLTACDDDSDTTKKANAANNLDAAVAQTAPQPQGNSLNHQQQAPAAEKQPDMCDSVPRDIVAAAFKGKLDFGKVSLSRSGICSYKIRQGEDGNQLSFGPITPGRYSAYKSYENNPKLYRTIAGLGLEAFMIGSSQLQIKINEEAYFSLSIVLLTIDIGRESTMPATNEEIEAGLIELGRILIKNR